MRPRSMTGFGRGETESGGRTWVAEVRTVNHRFLDQRIVLPRSLNPLEDRIRKIISSNHDRGRVEVSIQLVGDSVIGPLLSLNTELARQYYSCLIQLKSEMKIESPVELSDMLSFRDIISQKEQNPDLDVEWKMICSALDVAIGECCSMREQEGKALKEDLFERLESFSYCLEMLQERVPEIVRSRNEELKKRLGLLLEGMDLDPVRFAQEAAIMADKTDVTEELVRLRSHIAQFTAFLESSEPVGRRLDFLLQEFLREVNTIASKISNADITHMTVDLKNEIEKLREQVQNIE
ncbi:MAG: YicC/YloC family endoribonuclease [Desulfobulbaceae bacterium]|nr:YicC/YloC family endoribonuclease [Desulfobulbaceae bacterium]